MRKYLLATPVGSNTDYQADLNPQQLEVVSAEAGAIQVIAGAGSGKTRTLTYRVAYLIDQGISPESIMLCTFTNKAAKEMLSRVEHLVASRARDVWGGTFHHLANRILREFASILDYKPGFSILDREDSRDLLSGCISEQQSKTNKKMLPRSAVLGEMVSYSTNTLTPLDQVILHRSPALVSQLDDILAIACAYRERKVEINAMDFDDLLLNLNRLLIEYPDPASELSQRFEHILVDEYQDTNLLQCEIVDRLATTHRNLLVVGDDAQSIYGFRGANPDNMLQFAKRWPEAQLYKLEINYRSTPEILALANQSIQNNLFQLPKQLEAVRPSGQLPALVSVRDADVQAAFIAQRVLELVDEGIALKDMAVLYRAHHHSLELQVELTSREIPYMVRSGVRFFEQAHIKDILAYLRIIENPRDEISWLRILKMQPGIGRSGALKTIRQLMEATEPLDYATGIDPGQLPARSRAGLAQLQTQLKRILSDDIRTNPSRVILALLENGYRELLPTLYPNPQSRLDDIEQLAQYSEHFDSPVSFLSELNLLSEFGSETLVDTKHADDMLTLSTIHQAKGLEWKVVFVIGLNEGLFPHPRAINEEGGLEEERRLFYVSTTRTRDELYLVSPLVADRHGRRRVVMKPSRFISEIDKPELIERWSVENEPRQTGH